MFGPSKEKKKRVKLTRSSFQKAKQLLAYLRPYRGQFIIGWFFLLLSTSIGLIFPLLMGQLLGSTSQTPGTLDEMVKGISMDNVTSVAIILFITFGAQAVFSFFRVVLFTNVTENALRDFRKVAFERLIYMPMDFFNQHKVGELTSRIASDIGKIQETLRTTVAEFFRQIVMIFGGVTFLFLLSWKLALIMLSTVPVIIILAILFGRFIRKLSKRAQDETAKSNSIIEESLTGIANVKSFTNEIFMLKKYKGHNEEIRDLNVKSGLWRGVFISFVIFCLFGAIVFIVWQGLLMTQGPQAELAEKDFYSFIMFTIMMGASFGSIPELYASLQKAIGATESLIDIIETEGEKELFKGDQKPAITGHVTFKNVTFSYPQRKDLTVLKNINFDVKQNQTIALVGSSGAGKSTITSLLLNYYPLQEGSISFDGVNIMDIDIQHLRKNLAIVPQEVILFAGTIKDNIAFGDENASEEEIIEAAKKANAWEFINSFPEKLDTQVGDRGIQLSGGQKQRIAIARAILNDPAILILDEATSALDSESERLVQDALDKLMKGRTSFVIAHRLSTIKNADMIFVLENGEIKETGTHNDLISQNGIYAKLVKLQGVQIQED